MTIGQVLLMELQHEAASTRKLLECVPFDKATYKPHEKSMSLAQLAGHVADISSWWAITLLQNELDFAKSDYKPQVPANTEELLKMHDDLIAQATKILTEIKDEVFQENWTMRTGDTIYFTMPKAAVVRTFCMNHLYHHRGQLTVYLRMLDVALPGTYGPTADEQSM